MFAKFLGTTASLVAGDFSGARASAVTKSRCRRIHYGGAIIGGVIGHALYPRQPKTTRARPTTTTRVVRPGIPATSPAGPREQNWR